MARAKIRFQPVLRMALLASGVAATLSACASVPSGGAYSGMDVGRLADGRPRAYNRPYAVRGRWYTPRDQPGYDRTGLASWYGYESSSGRTADGERFDARLATAAHTTLPIPSWLEVTNLDNGRSARVRLNDRGPFVEGRILDLSKGAALELGFLGKGVARVQVRYLGPASPSPLMAPAPVWAKVSPTPVQPVSAPPHPVQVASLSPQEEVAEDLGATSPASDADPLPTPSPTSEAVEAGYSVQAGAFASRDNAERAARRLGEAGPASVRPLARGDGLTFYRVLIGPWSGPVEASQARARIAALGFADARVVTR